MIHRNYIKYGVIALVVILVVSLGYSYGYRGSVRLTLAPDAATMTIDNSDKQINVKDNQRLFLTPGEHTLTFYKNEFSIQKATVSIKSFTATTKLIALQPLTDAAKSIMDSSPNKERLTEYTNLNKSNIFKQLPVAAPDFTIHACSSLVEASGTDGKALCVDALDIEREQKAQLKIKEMGYNPDSYQIYSGGISAVKVVYQATHYKMLYSSASTLDKPLVIISTIGDTAQSPRDLKDSITRDMKQRGYDAARYYIYYAEPALTPFNTVKPEDVPLD